MGDGKAKFFTSDDFFQLCIDDEQQQQENVDNANEHWEAREVHAGWIADWKRENKAIKERNEVKKV